MGSCWCKGKSTKGFVTGLRMSDSNSSDEETLSTSTMISEFIMQMLELLSSINQRFDEHPPCLVKLHKIADEAEGWKKVMEGLANTIPLSSPLGQSTITIIFDDCPLPAVKTMVEALQQFELGTTRAASCNKSADSKRYERNMLVILGCMADKYAGPISAKLLTQEVIDYLFAFLLETRLPELVVQSLITIEKFTKTKENKLAFEDRFLRQEEQNSLIRLERHSSNDPQWRQIRFCARWLLDNYFFAPGRSLTYTTIDMSGTKAILDCNDSTELIKISPDGLGARCDSHTYESACCTFKVTQGCWYYEATVLTKGVMQIGWAHKETKFGPCDGNGDDNFSLTYDGCRRLVWHKAVPELFLEVNPWLPGDVVGCLIDVGKQEAIFAVNGIRLPICKNIFRNTKLSPDLFPNRNEGFHAAASFMCFQAAQFNFGADEFRFAPTDREFMIFNDHGQLTDEKKQVLPRWLLLQKPEADDDDDDDDEAICTICCDRPSNVLLAPCRHMGYCAPCAFWLRECPVCRERVWHYTALPL